MTAAAADPINNPSSTEHGSPHRNGHSGQNGYHKQTAVLAQDNQMSATQVAPDDGRAVSLEEYWAEWYEAEPSYEWNNGYLEAKPMSNAIQFRLFHWFFMLIREYVSVAQNADLMALETGFSMHVPNPKQPGTFKDTVRKPDLAVILHTNPVQWGDYDRSYGGICDVCIESISDSTVQEILRDTDIKKSEYEYSGVQEYYILDPAGDNMHFYEQNSVGNYVEIQPDAEGIIRSKVLPGFQFRYSDLTRQPTLEDMALDDAYRGFVLLRYQAAEARAAAAEQKATAAQQEAAAARQTATIAEQAAATERQRAEQYAAKLRALGINLDED